MEPLYGFAFYAAAIALMTLPCMLVGALVGRFLARRSRRRTRRRFARYGALLPVGIAIYALLWVVAMAVFGVATGRGFGDDFELPLNNGYHWSAVDVPDVASVFNKKDRSVSKIQGSYLIPIGDPVAFANVLSLQQRGDWLAGSYLDGLDPMQYDRHWEPDHWFLFNTRTHERIDAINEAELDRVAAQHGVKLRLESSTDFYDHHRYRWYDVVVSSLLCCPGMLLLFWIYKKTRSRLHHRERATGPAVV